MYEAHSSLLFVICVELDTYTSKSTELSKLVKETEEVLEDIIEVEWGRIEPGGKETDAVYTFSKIGVFALNLDLKILTISVLRVKG